MNKTKPIRLTVFASGRGSNLEAILDNIEAGNLNARVVGVISNNSQAGALEKAKSRNIQTFHISRVHFHSDQDFEDHLLAVLQKLSTDLILLAGYMKKVPLRLIREYKNCILNIHPALLPSFGGKGLYGHHVHEAVLNYGCKVSGVTVHIVDDEYDTGPPVLQRCVAVKDDDTPDTLAARVLEQEHKIYSEAIQLFAENRIKVKGRRTIILEKN